MWRRMVDTAPRSEGRQWEDSSHVPWLSVPAASVYHIQVDDHMVLLASGPGGKAR
jgi:hypothetical protein